MIVTSVETGWEIVFQASHALLAGQLAHAFRHDFRPKYWTETLCAILSHDDYKQAFDGTHYVTQLGAPKDFTLVEMDAAERFAEANRRIEQSKRKHTWMGLLISRHVEQLYGDDDKVSREMKKLLADQRDQRKHDLRRLGLKAADLERAYALLQWCDRCSLILARGEVPAMQRRIEVTHTLDEVRYELWQQVDETLCIEPWPFESAEVTFEVEVHLLTQLAFTDDQALIKHIEESEVEPRRWVFARP